MNPRPLPPQIQEKSEKMNAIITGNKSKNAGRALSHDCVFSSLKEYGISEKEAKTYIDTLIRHGLCIQLDNGDYQILSALDNVNTAR